MPVGDDHTLLWSGSTIDKLVATRSMTEQQYNCCVKVVDMIKSGDFEDYSCIKYRCD